MTLVVWKIRCQVQNCFLSLTNSKRSRNLNLISSQVRNGRANTVVINLKGVQSLSKMQKSENRRKAMQNQEERDKAQTKVVIHNMMSLKMIKRSKIWWVRRRFCLIRLLRALCWKHLNLYHTHNKIWLQESWRRRRQPS